MLPRCSRRGADATLQRTHLRTRTFGSRSIGTLLVVRFLLIANGLLLLAVGILYLLYGARPAGILVGVVLALIAVALFACVPLTDPYRRRR